MFDSIQNTLDGSEARENSHSDPTTQSHSQAHKLTAYDSNNSAEYFSDGESLNL